ncbi:hypothetical protein [Nocardia acidivorans]|uniref:hypothetical protein n=1 Tax=Nocardia acidivorans TaxID=404580 RepID=UPI00082C95C2|nr:hypothetical protein [Nocardia acidivorans]
MTSRRQKFAVALGVAALAVAGCSGSSGGDSGKIDVGVLVITMFDPENEVWLQREQLPTTVDVPGAYKPVRCNNDRLCVAETGQGKVNAATTMMAILGSGKFNFDKAYFLTAGTADGQPQPWNSPNTQGHTAFVGFEFIGHPHQRVIADPHIQSPGRGGLVEAGRSI